MRKINPAEEYQLKFLRREVDRTMEQWIAKPQHQDLSSNANQAQKELKEFVIKLRKEGVNI